MNSITLFFALIFSTVVSLAADPEVLIFSFQKQKNPEELVKTTQVVAQFLSEKIGKKIEVVVPTSYGTTVQGLISKKVHVAYMDSLPYLLALNEVKLEILAVEKRKDRTEYDSLIVVKKDSAIKGLQDLKGKRVAFASQTSTSGFLFPYYRLLNDGVLKTAADLPNFFSQIYYAGGYDKAQMAVINGQADAAAFSDYAFEGPKADLYGTSEGRSHLRVLARTEGVPTHLIATQTELSKALKDKIQSALLALSQEKPEVLSSVYGAAELVKPKIGNEHVLKTLNALKATGLEPKSFVK